MIGDNTGKAVDTYCRIILSITILICLLPTARADAPIDPIPSYLFLSIVLTTLFLLIFIGYLLRSRKIEKNRKIIRTITILLVVGLVLQSYLLITHKSPGEIWYENEISKPQFQYYVVNRSVDENTLSGGSIDWPMSVVYHNNSFVIAHISQPYSGLSSLIIRNTKISGEESSHIVIDEVKYVYVSGSSWPRMRNAVLTIDDEILVCYYSILNYDLEGNNISKMVTSIDGINWSEPEIIESHPLQFNYKDEISFPSRFEGYGFTGVDGYNVLKTSDDLFLMTIDFYEDGYCVLSSLGTFLSYSLDGEDWSEPIQIIEPYKLENSAICEISPGQFAILYVTGHGSFYAEFSFDDLQNASGPMSY